MIDETCDTNPGIQFKFISSVLPVDLIAGEADVALRISRREEDPSLIRRKVSIARFALFASKDYAEKYGIPKSEDDLAGHRFVSFRQPTVTPYFHRWLSAHVDEEQILQTYQEVELALSAVRSGRAIGINNVRLMRQYPECIQCFDPIEELDAEHLILISPEAYRRPVEKAFTKVFAPRYAALFRDP